MKAKEKKILPKVIRGFDVRQLIENQHRIAQHIQRGGTLKDLKETYEVVNPFSKPLSS